MSEAVAEVSVAQREVSSKSSKVVPNVIGNTVGTRGTMLLIEIREEVDEA